MACPCGDGPTEEACCGRWIAGTPAPTALALMRSRYTAYARTHLAYLLETHDASTCSTVDAAAVERWSRETTWLGLEILATKRGGPEDDDGTVEFIARGRNGDATFAQHERSRFRRVDGRWFYIDGVAVNEPVRRAATPGRNDPCSCGSGQKYKRCHGR